MSGEGPSQGKIPTKDGATSSSHIARTRKRHSHDCNSAPTDKQNFWKEMLEGEDAVKAVEDMKAMEEGSDGGSSDAGEGPSQDLPLVGNRRSKRSKIKETLANITKSTEAIERSAFDWICDAVEDEDHTLHLKGLVPTARITFGDGDSANGFDGILHTQSIRGGLLLITFQLGLEKHQGDALSLFLNRLNEAGITVTEINTQSNKQEDRQYHIWTRPKISNGPLAGQETQSSDSAGQETQSSEVLRTPLLSEAESKANSSQLITQQCRTITLANGRLPSPGPRVSFQVPLKGICTIDVNEHGKHETFYLNPTPKTFKELHDDALNEIEYDGPGGNFFQVVLKAYEMDDSDKTLIPFVVMAKVHNALNQAKEASNGLPAGLFKKKSGQKNPKTMEEIRSSGIVLDLGLRPKLNKLTKKDLYDLLTWLGLKYTTKENKPVLVDAFIFGQKNLEPDERILPLRDWGFSVSFIYLTWRAWNKKPQPQARSLRCESKKRKRCDSSDEDEDEESEYELEEDLSSEQFDSDDELSDLEEDEILRISKAMQTITNIINNPNAWPANAKEQFALCQTLFLKVRTAGHLHRILTKKPSENPRATRRQRNQKNEAKSAWHEKRRKIGIQGLAKKLLMTRKHAASNQTET